MIVVIIVGIGDNLILLRKLLWVLEWILSIMLNCAKVIECCNIGKWSLRRFKNRVWGFLHLYYTLRPSIINSRSCESWVPWQSDLERPLLLSVVDWLPDNRATTSLSTLAIPLVNLNLRRSLSHLHELRISLIIFVLFILFITKVLILNLITVLFYGHIVYSSLKS
jgi:hypothetical protein